MEKNLYVVKSLPLKIVDHRIFVLGEPEVVLVTDDRSVASKRVKFTVNKCIYAEQFTTSVKENWEGVYREGGLEALAPIAMGAACLESSTDCDRFCIGAFSLMGSSRDMIMMNLIMLREEAYSAYCHLLQFMDRVMDFRYIFYLKDFVTAILMHNEVEFEFIDMKNMYQVSVPIVEISEIQALSILRGLVMGTTSVDEVIDFVQGYIGYQMELVFE